MYSVAEVAKITKVSNVAIYKKIKKLKGLESYVVTKEGKTYILDKGLELIKQSLQLNNQFAEIAIEQVTDTLAKPETEENRQLTNVIELNNKLVNWLMEELKVKDRQLEAKDKQIDDQNRQIIGLHKIIENSQVLLKEEQKSRNEIKLISEEALKQHQNQFDVKIEGIKEKMSERAAAEIKNKRHWWKRNKYKKDEVVI